MIVTAAIAKVPLQTFVAAQKLRSGKSFTLRQ